MNITCISASNIKHAGENSTSLLACRLVAQIARKKLRGNGGLLVDIIRLADASLQPCIGCMKCFPLGKCHADDCFNNIYTRLAKSDAVFIVSPHYAPVPAKLCMLLEKMEEISFLPWYRDNRHRSRVYQIPVGIIAHGGGNSEAARRAYKSLVLDTIADALHVVMMDVTGLDEEWPTGVVFHHREILPDEKAIVDRPVFDWADVEKTLTPLVNKVLDKAAAAGKAG